MPKQIKEFLFDQTTGEINTEYDDNTTEKFNLAAVNQAVSSQAAAIAAVEENAAFVTRNADGAVTGLRTADGVALDASSMVGKRFVDLSEPFTVSHRGAGALLGPGSVMSAYKIGCQWGTGIVDGGDWRTVSDGGVFDWHDSTLDRISTSTGTVSDATSVQMGNIKIDSSTHFGGTWKDSFGAISPEQFFSEMRGLAVLCPQPNDLNAAYRVAYVISKLGMQEMVLPNSFTTSWLAPFKDVGCRYLFRNLLSAEHTAVNALAEGFMAAGITHVGIDRSNANALTAAADVIANGFKLIVGTISRHAHMTPFAGFDVAGWVSDDPLYTSNTVKYRRTTDPFASSNYYHGHQDRWGSVEPGPNRRGVFSAGKLVMEANSSDPNFILQGWGCPIESHADSYTISVDVEITTQTADKTRWPGVVVCSPDDLAYTDTGSTSNGYQIWLSPSTAAGGGAAGKISIVRKTDGAGGTTNFSPLSNEVLQGDTVTLAIAVTPTSISVTVSGAATGTVALADSTHRGAYFHLGHAGAASGLKVSFSNISIS